MAKPWYRSKTLWFNAIAIVGIILNAIYGIEMDAELQASVVATIIAGINLILRITTKQPIS